MRIPDGVQGRSVFNEGKIMQLTPDEIEAERERFEAWVRDKSPLKFGLTRLGDGYHHVVADNYWRGWLAAKQDAKEQA